MGESLTQHSCWVNSQILEQVPFVIVFLFLRYRHTHPHLPTHTLVYYLKEGKHVIKKCYIHVINRSHLFNCQCFVNSRYKLFLGSSLGATFKSIKDTGGYGEDHCELVGGTEANAVAGEYPLSPYVRGRVNWAKTYLLNMNVLCEAYDV